MGEIPVDKRGFGSYVSSLGIFSDAIVDQNREWNKSKVKIYLRFLKTRKKDFTLSSMETKSLVFSLKSQIGFFNYLLGELDDSYRKLKKSDIVLSNEKFAIEYFNDLIGYLRGLLTLYEEENLALQQGDIGGFYDLFNQERKMYKRIAKFLNSINRPKMVAVVKALKPTDRRGSVAVFAVLSTLLFSAMLAPGCFNENLDEGFREIGGGVGLVGSSIWNDAIVPITNWMWDGINLLGYHVPNWGAGLSVLVLIVLGLTALNRRL